MEKLGFIGAGAMGGGMIRALLRAGYDVVFAEPDAARAEALVKQGAQLLSSARDVADTARIVFACLPAPKVSEAIAAELAGAASLKIYIETSTVGRRCMTTLAEILGPAGVTLIDAPISGGPQAAEAGILSTVISGAPEALAQIDPIIRALAKHIFIVGDQPGQAQLAKLINNMLSMTARAATFEGMMLAQTAGLDQSQLAAFISVSTGRNLVTMDRFPARILDIFQTGGKRSIGAKDLELYLSEAAAFDIPLISTPQVLELFLEGERYDAAAGQDQRLSAWVQELQALPKT